MLPTGSVPCGPWPYLWCCDDLPNPNPDPAVQTVIDQSIMAASELLYGLSGMRFDPCVITLRPCRRDCSNEVSPFGSGLWPWVDPGMWPRPFLYNGAWFNLACGSCGNGCSCGILSEALLPGPVHTVTQVKVDGVVLAPAEYRMDNHRLLVRKNHGLWPLCQDLSLDDTEVGTWSVTASFGDDVPVLGQLAVGELGCQLAKFCLGDDTCLLPMPVQQLVRQGVTITFLDPNEVFAAGRIGLYQTDLFLQWANPHRLATAPQAYDVDGPSFRRAGT